jgi:hypothetical protein
MSARLTAVMFEASRQAPISARKAPSFSLEQAMAHIEQMKRAIATPNEVGAATRLQDSMINLGKTLHKDLNLLQNTLI